MTAKGIAARDERINSSFAELASNPVVMPGAGFAVYLPIPAFIG
jgi:hypothetical protein